MNNQNTKERRQTKNVDEVRTKREMKYLQTETKRKIFRKNVTDATAYMTGTDVQQKHKLVTMQPSQSLRYML